MSGRVWRLKVESFVGVLPYAKHYQGYIVRPWGPGCRERLDRVDHIEVESVLDDARARALTDADLGDFVWEPGLLCGRYLSREDLVLAAIKQWQALPDLQVGDVFHTVFSELADREPLARHEPIKTGRRRSPQIVSEDRECVREKKTTEHRRWRRGVDSAGNTRYVWVCAGCHNEANKAAHAARAGRG